MRSRLRLRTTRLIQVSIATTMLALPASALALTGATAADRQLPTSLTIPVRVSSHRITYGDSVTVTGAAAPNGAGRQVALQIARTPRAAWRRLATTRVGARGRFAFALHPRYSGVLRAIAPPSPRPGPTAQATEGPDGGSSAGSPGVPTAGARLAPVHVAARLHLPARSHDVLGGTTIRVAGAVLPGKPGRVIALQGHSAAGWRTVARARAGGRGGFAIRYRPSAGFKRDLRVRFAGDRANGRATAGAGSFTVFDAALASWYDDAGGTACGFHAGLGVANRSLPCGTKVAFRNGGRTVTATVDDHGPYVGGREWDLNQSTAATLGFSGVGTVWASVR